MKIALCLFGIIGGKTGKNGAGGPVNPAIAHSHYSKTLPMDDVDVFLHSWSQDYKDKLVNLYNPVSYLIEPQENFNHITMKNYGFESYDDWFKDPGNKIAVDAYRKQKMPEKEIRSIFDNLIFFSNSRWKSTKKVIELKESYEEEHDFKYDFIILGRYDISLHKKIMFGSLNKNKIYVAKRLGRVDNSHAVYDLIFIGGNEPMTKFGHLYDCIFKLPLRPPWAARHHMDNLDISHEHYLNNEQDYSLLRYNRKT